MEYVIRKASGTADRHVLSERDGGRVRVIAAGSPQAMLAAAKLFSPSVRYRDIYSYAEAAQAEQGDHTE